MRINKVIPYYTDQDRKFLTEYEEQIEAYFRDSMPLYGKIRDAKEAGDEVLAASLQTALNEMHAKKEAADTAREQLEQNIEQRYIDSFAGNTEAILADVREIIGAVEHGDFLSWHMKTAPRFKALLSEKPVKGSSKEEKERYKAIKQLTIKGYTTCYYFILEHVRAQLNALAFYQDKAGEAQVLEIVKEKTGSFYKQPKSAKPVRMTNLERSLPQANIASVSGSLLAYPQGPFIETMYSILSGNDLQAGKTYNRHIHYNIQDNEKENTRSISYMSDGVRFTFEIQNFSEMSDQLSPQYRKILIRALMHANKEVFRDGALLQPFVKFPLRELVGKGQYSSMDSARLGFYKAGKVFQGFRLNEYREKNNKFLRGGGATPFPDYYVEDAFCYLALSPNMNWSPIVPYITVLPDYYFELSGRAADLLQYIFYLARQNTRKIQQDGFFTISYRAIQSKLNLPDEKSTKNPGRDIKNVIDNTVAEIEDKYSEFSEQHGNPDFALELLENDNDPIGKYLDEGKLKVYLKGSYAQRFIEISKKTTKQIEAAKENRNG